MPLRAASAVVIVSLAASCSGGSTSGPPSSSTSGSPSSSTSSQPAGGSHGAATVWLCRPGLPDNPCMEGLDSTAIAASGTRSSRTGQVATTTKFDCFYVYPTVSSEPGANADLTVQPAERGVAFAQASRFSQVCRVFAPMYRQRTVPSLAAGLGADPSADDVAFQSLEDGWQDYLAHDNDGRPIVFIGHSQGAAMLVRLLQRDVDPNPAVRAHLVSAVILGGNVTVRTGESTDGTFHNLPACTAAQQTGCVIAYSTFPGEPPPASLFGRPGQGVSLQSGQTATANLQVLCVNPAAIGGGAGQLDPYFATATQHVSHVTTPWTEFPGRYTATCENRDGATWLQVTPNGGPADTRPVEQEAQGPLWGFHADDVNLALGNLIADVSAEEAAYAGATH